MSELRPATYGYEELAARIEEVLGERPSRSALRAAWSQERRTELTLSRPRVTVGMPQPLPSPARTAPAFFDVEEIERWLARHPRLVWRQAVEETSRALGRGDDVELVISRALTQGLSWRTITALLVEHDGQARSVSGVHKRYRHLSAAGD